MVALATKPKKPREAPLKPLPSDAHLLSLDCSSSVIGYAFFEGQRLGQFGIIKSPASWLSKRRIDANTDKLRAVMEDYVAANDCLLHVVEEWQSHKSAGKFHAQGLSALGQSQGQAKQMLREMIEVVSIDCVSEREWTKINGRNAKKEKRAEVVRRVYPQYAVREMEEPGWDNGLDAADACGLGLYRLSIRSTTDAA